MTVKLSRHAKLVRNDVTAQNPHAIADASHVREKYISRPKGRCALRYRLFKEADGRKERNLNYSFSYQTRRT